MKIIKPSVEFYEPIDGQAILKHIEKCGRVCYKSENKMTDTSAEKFVAGIIKKGHEAVLEHVSFTVKFTCDRGVSHEGVRHRLSSFCQESTRYCNYSGDQFGNEITVIKPCWIDIPVGEYKRWPTSSENWIWTCDGKDIDGFIPYDAKAWLNSMSQAEDYYFTLLEKYEWTPQEARAVLPNSLKTELVMTANLREWRHFFKLRCSLAAHPQMRELAIKLLNMCKEQIPVLFDDINY